MGPERKIENYLVKRVRETGGFTRKLKWIGRNGAPDRMVWWKPSISDPLRVLIYFVELKAPGKKPTKQQAIEHQKMWDSGIYLVRVLDSEAAINDFIVKAIRNA